MEIETITLFKLVIYLIMYLELKFIMYSNVFGFKIHNVLTSTHT